MSACTCRVFRIGGNARGKLRCRLLSSCVDETCDSAQFEEKNSENVWKSVGFNDYKKFRPALTNTYFRHVGKRAQAMNQHAEPQIIHSNVQKKSPTSLTRQVCIFTTPGLKDNEWIIANRKLAVASLEIPRNVYRAVVRDTVVRGHVDAAVLPARHQPAQARVKQPRAKGDHLSRSNMVVLLQRLHLQSCAALAFEL